MRHRGFQFGFTLLELMAVTVLMTVAVSAAAWRLDGVSDQARLTAATTRIGSVIRLAKQQARTDGVARLLTYPPNGHQVRLHKPLQKNQTWGWDEGASFDVGNRVTIERVLIEGAKGGSKSRADDNAIRISGSGRHRSHAVILRLNRRWAILLAKSGRRPRTLMPSGRPQAMNYGALITEMEGAHEAR